MTKQGGVNRLPPATRLDSALELPVSGSISFLIEIPEQKFHRLHKLASQSERKSERCLAVMWAVSCLED